MRITVEMTQEEQAALAELAKRERRPTRMQAAVELKRALERHGLLTPVDRATQPATEVATS